MPGGLVGNCIASDFGCSTRPLAHAECSPSTTFKLRVHRVLFALQEPAHNRNYQTWRHTFFPAVRRRIGYPPRVEKFRPKHEGAAMPYRLAARPRICPLYRSFIAQFSFVRPTSFCSLDSANLQITVRTLVVCAAPRGP